MSYVSRDKFLAIEDDPVLKPVFGEITAKSFVLPLMRQTADLFRYRQRIAVQDSMATADWVNPSEGMDQENPPGFKKTTTMSWANKHLEIAELAALVPIPDSSSSDVPSLWEAHGDSIANAIQAKIDSTILVGVKPNATWPDPVITTATAKSAYGYKIVAGTHMDALADISEAQSAIEKAGYIPKHMLVLPQMMARFRNLRDADGRPLLVSFDQNTASTISGMAAKYVDNGSFAESNAMAIIGAFQQCIYSFRNKMTMKLFTEGVIQDPDTGAILYNLIQNDMKVLRVTFEMAWQIPNPINRVNQTEAERYPFSIITTS